MNKTQKEMIEKFQCPGCVAGGDTDCGSLTFQNWDNGFRCQNHVAGTALLGVGSIFLGLPRGFNKAYNKAQVVLFEERPTLDAANIPVWYTDDGDHLILKVVSPRINQINTYVIKDWGVDDLIYNTKSNAGVDLPFLTIHPINMSDVDMD